MTKRLSAEAKAKRRYNRQRSRRISARREKYKTKEWQAALLLDRECGVRTMGTTPADELRQAIHQYVKSFFKLYESGAETEAALVRKERGACQIVLVRLDITYDGNHCLTHLVLRCAYRGKAAPSGRYISVTHHGDIAKPTWAADLDAALWSALLILNGAPCAIICGPHGPFDAVKNLLPVLEFELHRDSTDRVWAIVGKDGQQLAILEVWNGRFKFRPISDIHWKYAHRELHLPLNDLDNTAQRIRNLCNEIVQIMGR